VAVLSSFFNEAERRRELSASTGGCGVLVHPDSKVELEKCEMTDEPRVSVYEGMKGETTVSSRELGNN
jgi:hypothetical protein